MSKFEELCKAIEAQQKGREGTDVFVAGEQMKDICRGNEHFSELVLTDLTREEMRLEKAVQGIRDYAKKHEKKDGRQGFGYCPPAEAERILRKFYGLPEAGREPEPPKSGRLDLLDFI